MTKFEKIFGMVTGIVFVASIVLTGCQAPSQGGRTYTRDQA
jgi:hypothetical protein